MSADKTFADQVAEKLIQQLEQGTSPLQRLWRPGEMVRPYNPTTGRPYKGGNSIWLSMQDRGDPRWLTYKQASDAGGQVRKGEKGCVIQYLSRTATEKVLDEAGRPVLGAGGKPLTKTVQLERPKVFRAVVFNAEQIDGMPPLAPRRTMTDSERNERCEAILSASQVPIRHLAGDSAYYNPVKDEITVPERSQFNGTAAYYAVTLHELGHATGHSSRLNRDLSNPFGSEGYAREELRAEIASLILGEQLEIGFDPGHHAAYVRSWIGALKDDPAEIFKAAADAEKIAEYINSLVQSQQQDNDLEQPMSNDTTRQASASFGANAVDRRYIAVPYAEREEAKRLGAKYDPKAKSWFVPDGLDDAVFKKWPLGRRQPEGPKRDPEEEFGEALKAAGFLLAETRGHDDKPKMDGEFHRVRVEGDKPHELGGVYRGFKDGVMPAGYFKNYRTGEEQKWRSSTVSESVTPEDRDRLMRDARERQQQRTAEILARYETKATELAAELENGATFKPASPDHGYLVAKGLTDAAPKLIQDARSNLVITAHDIDGKVWSAQRIGQGGWKGFTKDARKEGCMHVNRTGSGPIVIAEGWANAETLAKACDELDPTVITAFDRYNLRPVAEAMRKAHPDRPILIAGDNDAKPDKPGINDGLTSAKEAAQAANAHYVIPETKPDGHGQDWSDVYQQMGLPAVKEQIAMAMVLADRRRLAESHELGRNAESVEADIVARQSNANLARASVNTRSASQQLRNAASKETDVQDTSREKRSQEELAAHELTLAEFAALVKVKPPTKSWDRWVLTLGDSTLLYEDAPSKDLAIRQAHETKVAIGLATGLVVPEHVQAEYPEIKSHPSYLNPPTQPADRLAVETANNLARQVEQPTQQEQPDVGKRGRKEQRSKGQTVEAGPTKKLGRSR